MSTHPNAMLLLSLTPDDLARKTYRAILAEADINDPNKPITIEGKEYLHRVMEEEYYESSQISAKEGDIVLWDLVTYGYGDQISWGNLEEQMRVLEKWAKGTCEKHHCSYEIFVSANYW